MKKKYLILGLVILFILEPYTESIVLPTEDVLDKEEVQAPVTTQDNKADNERIDFKKESIAYLNTIKDNTKTLKSEENKASDDLNEYSDSLPDLLKSMYADEIRTMRDKHVSNDSLMDDVDNRCSSVISDLKANKYNQIEMKDLYQDLEQIIDEYPNFANNLKCRQGSTSISDIEESQAEIEAFYTNISNVLGEWGMRTICTP
ncbi:MAG: hypothetical protein HFG37_06115 [Eubacterium sp.]|nr:hypothetical protein [Eubacterium sp.]